MSDEIERANRLYWQIVFTIERALIEPPRADEPIEERSKRLAMWMLTKGKAKSIINEMREAGFISADFVPSADPVL